MKHPHTPEQVVRKLAGGERILNGGGDLAAVLRTLEISEATWNKWRPQYGGMKATEAKRMKDLEAENARLKKLVANQALDIDMLKELAEGAPPVAPLAVTSIGVGIGCTAMFAGARWKNGDASGSRRGRFGWPYGRGCVPSRCCAVGCG